ncbi:hypothetical protein X741_29545 [Mesorhizobium sp. LNHC229A00]|nr:hypothetical protein X741_29545 [Mesorhizobium sp. LNHC229A00]
MSRSVVTDVAASPIRLRNDAWPPGSPPFPIELDGRNFVVSLRPSESDVTLAVFWVVVARVGVTIES